MSLKGLKKAVVRAPQNFRQKLNMGEVTVDPVYVDAERRFKEIEVETKKLSEESTRYFSAVNGMLDSQIEFSKAIEEIYKPISGRLSDPNSAVPEDNPDGIQACEQYREMVNELKETLKPDLELIETRVVEPAKQLLKVIQAIRKMAVKREHKQIDLDRQKRNLKKYQDKKERSVKDEERMYAAEAEVSVAQQEYDYYNDMLKTELPILFQMQSDFIKPLFVSFYYMQLNVFYTLYTRMDEMKIPYFDLNSDIVEAYTLKKGNIEEVTDAIGITHFKVGHAKSKLEAAKRRQQLMNGEKPGEANGGGPQYGAYAQYAGGGSPAASTTSTPSPAGAGAGAGAFGQAPALASSATSTTLPAYTPTTYGNQFGADQKATYNPQQASPAAATAPVYGAPQQASPAAATAPVYGAPQQASPAAATAPVYGAPQPAAAQTCTALYDYTAQAQGDLSFTAGSVIEVLEKTPDANGWWTGRLNGQTGVFPGNYVQLN